MTTWLTAESISTVVIEFPTCDAAMTAAERVAKASGIALYMKATLLF